jgi:hypothetical protein
MFGWRTKSCVHVGKQYVSRRTNVAGQAGSRWNETHPQRVNFSVNVVGELGVTLARFLLVKYLDGELLACLPISAAGNRAEGARTEDFLGVNTILAYVRPVCALSQTSGTYISFRLQCLAGVLVDSRGLISMNLPVHLCIPALPDGIVVLAVYYFAPCAG